MQYELQEFYGIGNLVGNDPGKECLLCLSEPRDTTLLCRHMVRPWGMVGRGLGAWCDTWTMGHPRPKANFKGVWRGVASPASLGQVY
ncbi:hypothetical protein HanXRQr2_Chr17g0786541 [Helianthus annuus]|uniref:Zinc finger, RING/FYVE/PHD-type n=1 Tax=Helianthus annuus TaxID=4232 RepID=A0A9K3GTA7_HELAN|nr:hypothetical protein HanXRQr2_Chr17g0786541 [Helianthus annuus]KAJ0811795.1 hypothetical protein HanPSC8_Chr17g0754741 [Helianthus annuus]